MSTMTPNVHSSLDPRENQDQWGLLVRKEQRENKETWAVEDNQATKARGENMVSQASRVRKVWSVPKVHLDQLGPRVLLGDREKLVKKDTWGQKVNWVIKA